MKAVNVPKVWFRFTKTLKNGENIRFRWEQLPRSRFEEFLDFKMKYYVKDEVTHRIAGIHTNSKALDEYRNILANVCKSPSYQINICCTDDENNKMVGFSASNLYIKGEIYNDVMQAKTPEVQRFYEILHKWNNLCPVPDILNKYGVTRYCDDAGLAIHPDYRGYNFTKKAEILRDIVCKANKVTMTGAWMTAAAMQTASKHEGWETVYEVSREALGKILGLTFPNTTQTPAVVGMLWEVTDLEVDKVVTSLVSLCVPSTARLPWSEVGKEKWSQGILDTKVESSSQLALEPDLLRAIVRSRASSNFVMISSSVVCRGLPVKIR